MSVAILLIGHGLQLSLLPLRAESLGWSSSQIGVSSSFYFGGLLLGCLFVPGIVRAVGHIRAFLVLTAIMTAALLIIALTNHFLVWLVLRLSTGCSIAGLYLVIESWLNEEVSNDQRGAVVSMYTIIALLGMALGQLLLNIADPTGHHVIVVASLFVALAALPVGLTRLAQPSAIPGATFSPMRVLQTSRAAVVASFVGGMVTGCFFGLAPVYGRQVGLDVSSISLMMAAGISGGAVLLWPLGRLSDVLDRRLVILASMVAAVLVCGVIIVSPARFLTYLFFLFGGCILPIYGLSLAHAGDSVKSDFLEVGTGILIFNAVGATVGPLLAATLMQSLGASSFFAFCGGVLILGAIAVLVFVRRRPALREHFSPFELATSASAQGAIELDPRSKGELPDAAART